MWTLQPEVSLSIDTMSTVLHRSNYCATICPMDKSISICDNNVIIAT